MKKRKHKEKIKQSKHKKIESKSKSDIKEIGIQTLLGFLVLFAALPVGRIDAVLKLTLVYFLFIYLPFIPLGMRKDANLVERYLLINIAGLSYGAIFVFLDVLLKIPLTKTLYFFTAFTIGTVLWWLYLSKKI